MGQITIELGKQAQPYICACCSQQSHSSHGFLYKDSDAHAVYFAGWTEGHADRYVTLKIAIAEWTKASEDPSGWTTVGLEARPTTDHINFTVIDPDQSPWGHDASFGPMLSRARALANDDLQQFFHLAEHIVDDVSRVKHFLESRDA